MKKQVTVLGGLAVLAAINMVPAMADDAPAEAYTPAAVARTGASGSAAG